MSKQSTLGRYNINIKIKKMRKRLKLRKDEYINEKGEVKRKWKIRKIIHKIYGI